MVTESSFHLDKTNLILPGFEPTILGCWPWHIINGYAMAILKTSIPHISPLTNKLEQGEQTFIGSFWVFATFNA